MRKFIGVLPLACLAMAQTQIDLPTQVKRVDFSAAVSTKPVKTGATLPATCNTGEMFFKTDPQANGNLFACTAPNTWQVQGRDLTISNSGTVVGARGSANFITGAGLTTFMTDTGSRVDIETAIDPAIVQTQSGAQAGTAVFCDSRGGATQAFTCMLSPTASAYTPGMLLHWRPDVNGAGGPPTLNVDGLGAKAIKRADGSSDLSAAEVKAGQMYALWYDGGAFRILAGGAAEGLPNAALLATYDQSNSDLASAVAARHNPVTAGSGITVSGQQVSNTDPGSAARTGHEAAYDHGKLHTQGTDQGLDTGGANAVTASQAKAAYNHSGTTGNPHGTTAADVGAVATDGNAVVNTLKIGADAGLARSTANTLKVTDGAGGDGNLVTRAFTATYLATFTNSLGDWTYWELGYNGLRVANDKQILWSGTNREYGTVDTAVARDSASVVKITDGGAGFGGLKAAFVTLAGGSKPGCDATQRGKLWFTSGGAGAKDGFEICAKGADDQYAWRLLY